ncbi:MAG: type IV secretion system DNA-binding domain-containing protein [Candidatus Pacebacteria bacterium]|nr:type IV secretion system DNA-binding domain-containing protein [Candidatus Paceibacterota bacterium]
MAKQIAFFAETTFRNIRKKFGIKTDDRRRHVYAIGKTGMGKSKMLENMAIQDIQEGKGIGFVDPHGEAAEELLEFVPSNRINDVIYFNPADLDWPIAFNVMEKVDVEHRHLVAGGLMGVFKKIWPDVWSARMEYILNNTILALLEYPGSTLLGINRMLSDPDFRKKVIEKVTDPIVKAFWLNEFANYTQRYEVEATAAIQNKVGQFISAPLIRNIVGQVRSSINMREVMDKEKILILNLSKGRIGEDNSMLLGALLITKLQLAAMSRVDIPEEKRKDFYLYVDEFQNFATESFVNILSEARKYRLALILAHQYIAQMDEKVRDAVFGNVGTIISFRIGAEDAEFLEKEFGPEFNAEDFVNLAKYDIYLKLMIDGLAGRAFSARTLEPFPKPSTSNKDKIVNVSREKYATPRKKVEEKISKWIGFLKTDAVSKKASKEQKEQTLYDARCALCGKDTKVVFPPDSKRPVYCKSCFKKIKESPNISLDKAIETETVTFGRSPKPVQKPQTDSLKKKKKEVNLEELKKTLKESLNRFKDENKE